MEGRYFSRNVKSRVRAVPGARKVISAVRAVLELVEDAQAVLINGATRQLGKGTIDLPPMHTINLEDERGHIRRSNIKEHVSKYGVEVILSPAVDKNKMEYAHYEQSLLRVPGHVPYEQHERTLLGIPEWKPRWSLWAGVAALVQSHSLLYKKLLDSSDPYMLIAEDDICIDKTFKEKLSIVLSRLPDNFDIVSFECGDRNKHNVVDKNVLSLKFKNGNQRWTLGAGLYLISRKGAKQLLEKNNPDFPLYSADYAFVHCLKKDNVHFTIPPLGWQSNEERVMDNGGRY